MQFFTEHPASVGETYVEHLGVATSFGMAMIVGGLACIVHGLVPSLCMKTGSKTILSLHERMVSHRLRSPERMPGLDYVI